MRRRIFIGTTATTIAATLTAGCARFGPGGEEEGGDGGGEEGGGEGGGEEGGGEGGEGGGEEEGRLGAGGVEGEGG